MAIFNSYVSLPEGDIWKLSKGAWTFLDSWPGSEVGSLLDVSYPNPSAISYFLIIFDTSSSYHHGFTHHFKSRNPPNFLSESGGPQNCDFTRDNDILTFSEPGGLMFFSPAPFFSSPDLPDHVAYGFAVADIHRAQRLRKAPAVPPL